MYSGGQASDQRDERSKDDVSKGLSYKAFLCGTLIISEIEANRLSGPFFSGV